MKVFYDILTWGFEGKISFVHKENMPTTKNRSSWLIRIPYFCFTFSFFPCPNLWFLNLQRNKLKQSKLRIFNFFTRIKDFPETLHSPLWLVFSVWLIIFCFCRVLLFRAYVLGNINYTPFVSLDMTCFVIAKQAISNETEGVLL